jgi:hypothetical protein
MLSNFQLGGHSLLQIFLLGQPEFRQTLFHSPALEQLRQRVIATHHLDPMEPEEVEPYILHRLGKVGWTGNPSFSPDAFEEIFDYSEGVPRKLNVLVSRLLLYGAVEQMNRITAQNVRSVVAEIESDRGIDAATLAPLPVDQVVAAAAAAVAPTPAPFVAPAPVAEAPLEWPQHAADQHPPFAAPAHSAQVINLTPPDAPEADVFELAPEAAVETPVPAPAAPAVDPEHLAALEQQVASLEERLVEQDAALRRVLDLLIEWVERDPENAPNPATSRTWAA